MNKTGVAVLIAVLFVAAPLAQANDKAEEAKERLRGNEVVIEITLQPEGTPGFAWDQAREAVCQKCPRDFHLNATLAPADLESASNGAPCQVFYWTGERPRVDTRPILGIVYIHPECALSWVGTAT